MATTMFFEQTVNDMEKKDTKITLEFGRSSFYRENLMYLTVDGKSVIVNEKTGREIFAAMQSLGSYLGYDRRE